MDSEALLTLSSFIHSYPFLQPDTMTVQRSCGGFLISLLRLVWRLLRGTLALSLAFDPSGFFLATASRDNTVRLSRLSANKLSATCVAILNGHNGPVNSVQFHQTKPILVTGSTDMRVIVYKL